MNKLEFIGRKTEQKGDSPLFVQFLKFYLGVNTNTSLGVVILLILLTLIIGMAP